MSKSRQRRKKRKASAAKTGAVRSVVREAVPVGTEDALSAAISVDADLPAEHPLRHQAAILRDAFCAVTTGPVTPDEIRLYEVPRSSPLAPWKTLIRAIAHFYRCEDDHCRRALAMIPADSTPARLVPVMTALLDRARLDERPLGEAALMGMITGAASSSLLELAAAALMHLNPVNHHAWKIAARMLAAAVRKDRPDLLQELQAKILHTGLITGLTVGDAADILVEPLKFDPGFWLICARIAEEKVSAPVALVYWDIALGGIWTKRPIRLRPEERSAVAIRMLRLAIRCHQSDDFGETRGQSGLAGQLRKDAITRSLGLASQDGEKLETYMEDLASPIRQFYRFAEEEPHPLGLELLLDWLNPDLMPCNPKAADRLLEVWGATQPQEIAPHLRLALLAERRGAFTKAIRHLDAARRLGADSDRLDRAYCGLLVSRTLKRMKEKKLPLAQGDIQELESSRLFSDSDLMAVVGALRWAHLTKAGDPDAAEEESAALVKLIGFEPAKLMLVNVARAAGLSSEVVLPRRRGRAGRIELLDALLWVLRVQGLLNLSWQFPTTWDYDALARLVNERGSEFTAEELGFLGKVVLATQNPVFRYAVSRVGLTFGSDPARFLFVRATCFDRCARYRQFACWYYAAAIVLRDRNTSLRREMLIFARDHRLEVPPGGSGYLSVHDLAFSQEEVDEVIRREIAAAKLPTGFDENFSDGAYGYKPVRCCCDACRPRYVAPAATRERFPPEADPWDDDDYDEGDEFYEDDERRRGYFPFDSYENSNRGGEQTKRDRARNERKRKKLHKKKQQKKKKKK